MRRLIPLLLLLSSCQRQPSPADVIRDDSAELVSGFAMDEPAAASQLLSGFYNLEGAPWRWTKQNFSVLLHAPQGPAQLKLYITVPDLVLSRLGPITITATVNSKALPPETFSKEGFVTYIRDIEAQGNARIEFHTDKALVPGTVDDRELALIVSRVELTAK